MDGHFVPPITMGPIVVSALRDMVHGAGGVLEVHLMIERPERQIAAFADAGADLITIHAEATPHVNYALAAIREAGCQAGLAFNPATPPDALAEVRGLIDLALCMTVNPGWGGQAFIAGSPGQDRPDARAASSPASCSRSTAASTRRPRRSRPRPAPTRFVAGSAVFGAADPAAAYAEIAAAAGCG